MIILLFFGGWGSLSDSHEIVWSEGWHTTVDSTSSSICRQSASASLQWTTSGSCISRAILICLMNTSFCWAAYWPWLHTQQSYWPWLQTHNRGVDHSYKHPQQSYWPRLQTHTTEGLTMARNTHNRVTDQGYKHTQQRGWPWLETPTTELLTKATNTHNRGVDHGYKHPQQSYWPRLQTHTTEGLTIATNTPNRVTKATNTHNRGVDHGYKHPEQLLTEVTNTHNRGVDYGYKHTTEGLTMATNTYNSYLLTMDTNTYNSYLLTMATNTYNRVTDQGYKQHNRVTDQGYKQHNRGISPREGNSKQPIPSSSCISKPLSEYGWPSTESLFLRGCISVFCTCMSVYSDRSMHKAADFLRAPETSISTFCQPHNSQTKCINKLIIQCVMGHKTSCASSKNPTHCLILGKVSRECPVTGAVGPHHAFFMPVKQRGIITGPHTALTKDNRS